jgi:copper chaperone
MVYRLASIYLMYDMMLNSAAQYYYFKKELFMYTFTVHDMMCNHCIMHITQSIHAIDKSSKVQCNLDSKTVTVDSSLDINQIIKAIKDAGYTPVAQ